MSKKKVLLRGVFINRDTNGEGVLKVGTTLIRVSTVMGILYYEKATNKLSKKKMEQYDKILKLMDDGDWHKTAEIAENLGLKDTRTKEC